jgi:hypothetical protein
VARAKERGITMAKSKIAEAEDKLADAKRQGQAQFDSIKEMVEYLRQVREADAQGNIEDAEQQIHEDALSVQVRSGWYPPLARGERAEQKAEEYEILLCTGGPACRIVGKLSEHGEPETASMEVQDWFQPWTAIRPLVHSDFADPQNRECYDSEPILLEYARCFWFGE